MSLQRLYDLDGSFPDRLDELLRDATYVEELRKLPGPELSELLDHLDEVHTLLLHASVSSNRRFYRSLSVSIVPGDHPESASKCCEGYAVLARSSLRPTNCPDTFCLLVIRR